MVCEVNALNGESFPRPHIFIIIILLFSFPVSLSCHPVTVMFPTLLVFFGLATIAYSTALTTLLSPNERVCFYADVDKAGEKIGVRLITFHR